MNTRNMPSSNRTIELEVAQQMQNQQHAEPFILLGSPPNFPQSNAHQSLPASGSINNFGFHRLPEHQDGTALYRIPLYAQQVHPVANLELGIPAPCNFYNPYLSPASGAGMFFVPRGSMDQLPSSTNFGASSGHLSVYGMNGYPPEGFQVISKGNGAEGYMGNIQYLNAPPAPTVCMPPLNVGHFDGGVATMDTCFPLPEYRGNFVSQSIRPPAANWCHHQPNGIDDSTALSFNCPPTTAYFDVSNGTGGSSQIGGVSGQRFYEGASTGRGSQNRLHYASMLHPPQNIHGASRYNAHYRPPAATSSSRHPINTMRYAAISHPQQGAEPVPPPPGIRIYRSHRRSVMPEGIHRHPDLPHLRLLPEEGLAILEFAGHYEMSSTTDHHRDMRLDIDYMSYEELLALSERIGNVNTGLSENSITAHLKTKVHRSSMAAIDLGEPPCSDEKNNSCVICQDEYEDEDKIGSLDCGHEYHVECLKKWLLVKNACPICKSTALNVEHKSG